MLLEGTCLLSIANTVLPLLPLVLQAHQKPDMGK